jgi:hypothetical protein
MHRDSWNRRDRGENVVDAAKRIWNAKTGLEPKPGKKNQEIATDISVGILRLWAFSLFFV